MAILPKFTIEIALGQEKIGISFLNYGKPIEDFDGLYVRLLQKAIEQASEDLEKIARDVHMKAITKEVESWPKWKQNLLNDSLKPTLSEPRKPIINDKDVY